MFNIIRYIKRWWYKSDLEKRLKPIDEEFELFYMRPLVRTLKDYSWFSHAIRPQKLQKEKHTITIIETMEKPQEEINREILEGTTKIFKEQTSGSLLQRTNDNTT